MSLEEIKAYNSLITKTDDIKEVFSIIDKIDSVFDLNLIAESLLNDISILKMIDDLKLNEDEEINGELEQIKRLDEKLTAAKNYYNKNTSEENAIVRKFPTNIIAKIHGFKVKLFFDGKDMDDEIIDDFKM